MLILQDRILIEASNGAILNSRKGRHMIFIIKRHPLIMQEVPDCNGLLECKMN